MTINVSSKSINKLTILYLSVRRFFMPFVRVRLIVFIFLHIFFNFQTPCQPNEFYHPKTKTCAKFIGGGRVVLVDSVSIFVIIFPNAIIQFCKVFAIHSICNTHSLFLLLSLCLPVTLCLLTF